MTWRIECGDCLELLATLPEASIAAVVADPPYHLTSISKRFGKSGAPIKTKNAEDGVWARSAAGFMGQDWDSDIAFDPATWSAMRRALKPGGYLAAFGGTRTSHRMACAIEDGGFDVRDTLDWIYGSGFPHSTDFAKDFEKTRTAGHRVIREDFRGHPQAEGYGTGLRPSHEPIILAQRPLEEPSIARQVLATGTGGLHLDACRLPAGEDYAQKCASVVGCASPRNTAVYGEYCGPRIDATHEAGRWPPNILLSHDPRCAETACAESCPVLELERQAPGASRYFPRFRYCAKASTAERESGLGSLEPVLMHRVNAGGIENLPRWAPVERRNSHATVKPLSLMRWLCRLACPEGGTILDPFCGSGTTIAAAAREGFDAIGFDLSEKYCEIARLRAAYWETHDSPELTARTPRAEAPGQGGLWG